MGLRKGSPAKEGMGATWTTNNLAFVAEMFQAYHKAAPTPATLGAHGDIAIQVAKKRRPKAALTAHLFGELSAAIVAVVKCGVCMLI